MNTNTGVCSFRRKGGRTGGAAWNIATCNKGEELIKKVILGLASGKIHENSVHKIVTHRRFCCSVDSPCRLCNIRSIKWKNHFRFFGSKETSPNTFTVDFGEMAIDVSSTSVVTRDIFNGGNLNEFTKLGKKLVELGWKISCIILPSKSTNALVHQVKRK